MPLVLGSVLVFVLGSVLVLGSSVLVLVLGSVQCVLVLVLGSVRLSEGGGPIISGGVYYLRLEPWHSVVMSSACRVLNSAEW